MFLVLRQAVAPALTGIALGLAAALVTTRALSSMLFGLSSTDPLTFVLVPLALLLVSLLACLAPGWKASNSFVR
jgi:putative ABC transport system permease protein